MGKLNLKQIVKDVQTSIAKHSPEILTGLGIAGMVTTTVLAVRATPKALSLIEKEKNQRRLEIYGTDKEGQDLKLTVKDTVKATWKCYIPATVTGAASIACLIGACAVNTRRNAVLATAYKLSESALSEYKAKVVETIGERKERIIQEELDKDRMSKDPVTKSEVIITERGNTLCYDYYSKRYFKSDIEKIKKAVNEINKQILHEPYVSLNDFYYELGLEGIKCGDDIGWNSTMGLIDVRFSSQIADDGTPCIVVDLDTEPKPGFDKF